MSFLISKRSYFVVISLLLHAGIFYYANQIVQQHSDQPLSSSELKIVYQFSENTPIVKSENKKAEPVKEKPPVLLKANKNKPVNEAQSVVLVSTKNIKQIEADAVQEVKPVENIPLTQIVGPVLAHSEPEPKEPVIQTLNTEALQRVSRQVLSSIETGYTSELLQAIERHKRYPLKARRRGQEGEVNIRFSILKDGEITAIQVASSSGYASLDRASSSALVRLNRFKPIPWQLGRESWDFQVPVSFKLN